MNGDQPIGVFQVLTFGIALVGAVLGIINTWRAWSRDQPRLRVRCVRAFAVGGTSGLPSNMYGIEVTNLSTFPLVITEVGFGLRGTTDRMVFVHPYLPDNKPWPRTLPPREQVTVYTDAEFLDRSRRVADVYATTACGTTFRKKQRRLEDLLAPPLNTSNRAEASRAEATSSPPPTSPFGS